MTDLRTAAQQALEALEWHYRQGHSNTLGGFRLKIDEKAIRTLKAALEQPEQEPVAWLYRHKTEPWKQATVVQRMDHLRGSDEWHEVPLYAHPPRRREWRGLTGVEWVNIVNKNHAWFGMRPDEVAHEVCKLTEAKLKEKNT